jgi:hypothetical protein
MAIFRGAGGSGDATTDATNEATVASNAATAAATSASAASSSASSASTSATSASNSATAAATSETNAATTYDNFDDRYLGSKSTAPSVDNDGNTLLTGALYWNSTNSTMYVWGGSSWTAITGAGGSGTVTSITAGTGLSGGTITTSGTIAIDSTVATLTGSQTLTNKTISGSTNTLSSIGNASLTNSAITINGTSTSLGGSISVGTVTSVTGTAPVVSSGGATPAISMAAATTSANGYLTSTDWNTFNSKGSGTVTSASVVSANGFAGTVATATTTPAITLTTSITGVLKGNGTALSAATSGTDYSAGTSALATGIIKSTTTTGALSIAVAADFPTLNQNTTGSAATLTTPRAIYGNNFDGSAGLTQIIASTYGGTGNGFTKFTGPATAEKTFTLPNATATILTDNAVVTAVQGGTGQSTYAVGDLLQGAATNTLSKLAAVATGNALISGGVTTASSWGKIGLTTHITGTLAVGNGGTGATTLTGIVVGNGTSAFTTVTAPSGAIVGTTDTQTLTNKRITSRTSTTASSATPTINTDNTDQFGLTAQAVDITSFTTNLTGTPTDGQKLWIYIVGTAARAITWGVSFEASTVALPTTTVSTNRLDVGFVWNAATSKWRCVASA